MSHLFYKVFYFVTITFKMQLFVLANWEKYMNFIRQKRDLITLFLTIIALGLSIYFFFLHRITEIVNPDFYNSAGFYNSDGLEFVYLYKNLFNAHGSLQYWTFSPENYVVPDGLIFFILAFIVRNLKLALLLSNVLLLLLSYIFMVAIGRLTCNADNKNLFRCSALLFLILGAYARVFIPLFNAHFGSTWLMSLVNIYLILQLFKNPKPVYYILLAIFCCVTNFSDILFFPVFIVPAIISLLLLAVISKDLPRKLSIKIGFTVILSGLLGYLANRFGHFLYFPIFQDHELKIHNHAWGIFRNVLIVLFNNHPVYFLIDLFYIILISVILFANIRLFRTILNINTQFILLTILFCIIISIIIVVYYDTDLLYNTDFYIYRVHLHLLPAIFLPVFLGLPILLTQFTNVGMALNKCYEIITISIILSFFIVTKHYSLHQVIQYYPPITQCLDYYSQKGDLISKNGVAHYWDAHMNDVLTKENLNIVAVQPNLKAFNWMSTKFDYLDKEFNFVVIRSDSNNPDWIIPAQVVKTLGKPNSVLVCPNAHYNIYVYKKGFQVPEY